MDHEERTGLSRPVPRWFALLSVVAVISTGIIVALVVKPSSGTSDPASNRSAVSVTIPPNGIAGVTPQTVPDYTALVLSGSALRNLNLPDVHPWSLRGNLANGQVGTIGDIVLCSAGRPGTVRIVSVAALQALRPLQVVGFSTRPVEARLLGFNLGSLKASGFSPGDVAVARCNGSYQQALIGVHNVATTELGVEFMMTSDAKEEDKGLVLTYQDPDGTLRSLDIPIDVTFCAPSSSCAA